MADLRFDGEERFGAPPERVFALLTDLDRLGTSIPDRVSSERVDERTLNAVVRPGFSFLRGTMKLRVTLEELNPPTSAVMRIDSQGIGVSMQVESRMTLTPDGDGTKVVWQSNVTQMKGLVATISPGLVRAAAEQVVQSGWKQLHEQLDKG